MIAIRVRRLYVQEVNYCYPCPLLISSPRKCIIQLACYKLGWNSGSVGSISDRSCIATHGKKMVSSSELLLSLPSSHFISSQM